MHMSHASIIKSWPLLANFYQFSHTLASFTGLFLGERRPATDCSRMRKFIGYFPRKFPIKLENFITCTGKNTNNYYI